MATELSKLWNAQQPVTEDALTARDERIKAQQAELDSMKVLLDKSVLMTEDKAKELKAMEQELARLKRKPIEVTDELVEAVLKEIRENKDTLLEMLRTTTIR